MITAPELLLMAALAFLPGSADLRAGNDMGNARFRDECIILLHGLGRTSSSMSRIENALNQAGYTVWNESYPSTSQPVGGLASSAIEPGLDYCASQGTATIHFVTHSLGGILVRYFLQNHNIDSLGRIVMLAPPNHGTEIVDNLRELKLYQFITGPAGQQLGTGENSLPNRLGPVAGEIGIISGNSSSDPWFSWLIEGEDDGKVSIASTRLDEMQDFIIVDYGHTFIMHKDEVIRQIIHFLETGKFDHAGNSTIPPAP